MQIGLKGDPYLGVDDDAKYNIVRHMNTIR